MINLSRRGFLFGMGAFAIVRPEIIMPIKSIITTDAVVPLPPGAYDMFIDEVVVDAKTGRQFWKMVMHGQNYGLGKPMTWKLLEKIK